MGNKYMCATCSCTEQLKDDQENEQTIISSVDIKKQGSSMWKLKLKELKMEKQMRM